MPDDRPGYITAIINLGADLVYAQIPDPAVDKQQHLLLMVAGPEGLDVYVDGVPVDPDTGISPQEEAIRAADELIVWWKKSGWKLSTNTKKIQALVDTYVESREKLSAQELAKPMLGQVSPTPAQPPRLIPAVEGKPGWNEFINKIRLKYARGQVIPCSCNEIIATFDDLKIHWDQGHFDNQEVEKTPAHAFMPQREGPSSN